MNLTHIHLLVNHLPVFGSIIGAFVLAYGLFTKTTQTKMAAYYVFIVSALGAGVAYFTGEAAEESVENIQGIAKSMIEEHDEAATFALISICIVGALSIFAIFLTHKKSHYTRRIAFLTLFASLFSFSTVARTGYLGGQIRHTEIHANSGTPIQAGEKEEEQD